MGVADQLEERLHLPRVLFAEPDRGDLHAAGRVLVAIAVHFDVNAQRTLAGFGHRPAIGLEDPPRPFRLRLAIGWRAREALRGRLTL